uniref:Uncharacterized protein n=1 Tax=Anguilla anguilla TaxID=7936 RepID=A0A0E9RW07_ANGAN
MQTRQETSKSLQTTETCLIEYKYIYHFRVIICPDFRFVNSNCQVQLCKTALCGFMNLLHLTKGMIVKRKEYRCEEE